MGITEKEFLRRSIRIGLRQWVREGRSSPISFMAKVRNFLRQVLKRLR